MIIGWFFFIPSLGDVVAVASQGRFFFFFLHPSLGDVVADALQGRFLFLVFSQSGQKRSYLVKKSYFWTRFFEK